MKNVDGSDPVGKGSDLPAGDSTPDPGSTPDSGVSDVFTDGGTTEDSIATDAGAADVNVDEAIPGEQIATANTQEDVLQPLQDAVLQSYLADPIGPDGTRSASDPTKDLIRTYLDAYNAVMYGPGAAYSADHMEEDVALTLEWMADSNAAILVRNTAEDRATAADAGLAVSLVPLDDSSQQNVNQELDPVEMFSGQFVFDNEDVRIKGAGIEFVFHRTYKNKVAYDGPLGVNWDHSYNLWIGEFSETMLLCSNGALQEYRYTRHPKFGQAGFDYWVPPEGEHDVILKTSNSFERVTPGGVRYIHEPHGSVPGYHRLRRIEDRFGNFLAFLYTQNLLTAVQVNNPSRVVGFAYDAHDRITAITDHTARTWTYGYDDDGDLVRFTQPGTDRFGDGLTTQYEYSTSQYSGPLSHNLLRIIDPASRVYLENQYGVGPSSLGFNRVVRQRLGSGEIQLEYETIIEDFGDAYSDMEKPSIQVNLMDRGGQAVHNVYNKFGNLLLREEFVRTQHGVVNAQWRYRYNGDGAVIAILTPEGRLSQSYYGRDDFLRSEDVSDEAVSTHDALSMQARRAFGNLLAVVQRERTYDLPALDASRGMWGNVFPDIFATQPGDAVHKWAYEPDYQQVLTGSDPRFTVSADPRAFEGPDYYRTLTRFTYAGAATDAYRLLSKIAYPDVTQADGTRAPGAVETLDAYDSNGRLLQRTDATGVETRYRYFDAESGSRNGFLQSVVRDPQNLALTTVYERDDLGRITGIHLPRAQGAPPDQFVTRFEFNALDQVTQVVSSAPFNYMVRRFYDPNGMIARVERDAKDETGTDVPGAPEVRTFTYDDELHLLRETIGGSDLSKHLVTKHAYDAAGRRVATVLPKGNKILVGYDDRGLPSSVTRGAGTPDTSTTLRRFDLDGLLIESVSARGYITRFTRDAFGRITTRQDPLGNTWRFDYDKVGNLTTVRAFEQHVDGSHVLLARRELEYDEMSRSIRRSSNLFATPVAVINLSTDALAPPGPGRLLSTALFYDGKDRLVRAIDPLGRVSTREYDALNRLSAEVDPSGHRTENGYDANGNVIRQDVRELVKDPVTGAKSGERVFSRAQSFDQLDRLATATDSLGSITFYACDSRNNQVRCVDQLGNVIRNDYDIYNRRITQSKEVTDTGLGGANLLAPVVTQLEYDPNGNLHVITDALGRRTEQTFDARDLRRSVVYPDLAEMGFDYDRDSHLIVKRDSSGLIRRHTVDAVGRTIRVDVDKSGLPAGLIVEGATHESYDYDALGRLRRAENEFARIHTTLNSMGWPVEETQVFTTPAAPFGTAVQISRQFNDVGALTEVTYPGGRRVGYDRNELDQVTRIHNLALGAGYPGSSTSNDVFEIANFEYIGRQRSKCQMGNGASVNWSYDGARRLIDIRHQEAGAQTLLTIQQLFDAAGNMRYRNDITAMGTMGDAFRYDSLYQLTRSESRSDLPVFTPTSFAPATTVPADPIPNRQVPMNLLIGSLAQVPGDFTWAYDLAGNRDQERPPSQPPIIYSINALDQYWLVSGTVFTYDINGNLVRDGGHTRIYDSMNRLVRVLDTTSGLNVGQLFHDAHGRRILEITSGNATHFVNSQLNVIAEYRGGVPFTQLVHDDKVDTPIQAAAEGRDYWYHLDLVSSVRALTDRTGRSVASYSYAPFGSARNSSSGIYNPLRYASRRFDTTCGGYDFRTREYDPASGRFLQRDVAGMVDGTNLYVYSGNNPIVFRDALGTKRENASDMRSPDSSPNLPIGQSAWDVSSLDLGSNMQIDRHLNLGKLELSVDWPGLVTGEASAPYSDSLEGLLFADKFWDVLFRPDPNSFEERVKGQMYLQSMPSYRPSQPTLVSSVYDQVASNLEGTKMLMLVAGALNLSLLSWAGGTAALSSLGMFGSTSSSLLSVPELYANAPAAYATAGVAASWGMKMNLGVWGDIQPILAAGGNSNFVLSIPNWTRNINWATIQGFMDAGGTFLLRSPLSTIVGAGSAAEFNMGVKWLGQISFLEMMQIVSQGYQTFAK
jgi:RHS repeat-associated protein